MLGNTLTVKAVDEYNAQSVINLRLMGWADCDGQPRSLLQISLQEVSPSALTPRWDKSTVTRRDFACGRYVNHSSDCSHVDVVRLCI